MERKLLHAGHDHPPRPHEVFIFYILQSSYVITRNLKEINLNETFLEKLVLVIHDKFYMF